MKYIKVKIQELLAALKPSEFREFKEAILKKEYKKYLDHVFKGKDRIYIPFTPDSTKVVIPISVKNYLLLNRYKIADYKAGLAENEKGRLIKIGKLLKEKPDLMQEFNDSRSNVKKNDLTIVISRHPYDIAGMSTGRGWTSCTNLTDGLKRRYIHKDIENGTLIAYILDPKDTKKNIEHPSSRLLLKQYINYKNPDDKILYPDPEVYGADIPGFRERLIKWLETFQTLKGTYIINEKVNQEGLNSVGSDKNSDDERERLVYYKTNPNDLDAKKDKSDRIRKFYYEMHPDDPSVKNDEDFELRRIWFMNHPDDPNVKKLIPDSSNYQKSVINALKEVYYRKVPSDKDAKYENNDNIRYIYYDETDDPDAKFDEEVNIRHLYYKRNPTDKDAKLDDDISIRKLYYFRNPDDKDAKNDSFTGIRFEYYKNHKDDKDAKFDENTDIRTMYYNANGYDKHARKDPDRYIRFAYYRQHPEDNYARFDEDERIKKYYYSNHPDEDF